MARSSDSSNKIDLVFEEGTDFQDAWIWKDSNKELIPMVSWTAILEIREALYKSIELTLTQGAGVTLGASDGKIEVELSEAQIEALTFDTGLYTLVLSDILSNPEMFSRGTITVIRK